MYSLFLTDIIEKTKLPKDEVAVIRHALSDDKAGRVWRDGMEFFEEYQRIQPKDYFCKKRYIFSFINEKGTTARFIGVYEVTDIVSVRSVKPMKDYPLYGDYSRDDLVYYVLKKLDTLCDLSNRLVIEWGTSTQKIVQHKWETLAKKPVISIDEHPDDGFPGYENILWSFNEMKRYIKTPGRYPEIKKALSEVDGVYLVLDPIDNKQYIGSAYGTEGIYGRWRTYADTDGKGGADEGGANKKLATHLNKNKKRYIELQYSILAVFHRTGNATKDKKTAEQLEALYKRKLGTRNEETGLNLN